MGKTLVDIDPELVAQAQHILGTPTRKATVNEFGIAWPVLLVVAVAERHGVTVLHGDRAFDVIAGATGLRVGR